MNTRNRIYSALAIAVACHLAACGKSTGPPSVDETSAARSSLSDKVDFVEQFVTFRRSYTQLEYNIRFQNNGGGRMPGPSEWDVRLVAEVPVAEIGDWVRAGPGKLSEKPELDWLGYVPGTIDTNGISEWYGDGKVTIGLDRAKGVVAYRNLAL